MRRSSTRFLLAPVLAACAAQPYGERAVDGGSTSTPSDAATPAPDAPVGSDGGGPRTDGAVGGACDRARPFAVTSEVLVAGSYTLESARLNPTSTMATLALCATDGSKQSCDLFMSPFSSGTLGSFIALTSLNASGAYDSFPVMTPDGSQLAFGSSRSGAVRIYAAKAVNGSFDPAAPVVQSFSPELPNANEPYLAGGGAALYFAGTPSGSNWELYRATGWGTGTAAPATALTELGTSDDEFTPVVTDDELEIFFSSNRTGASGLDVYRSRRDAATDSFRPSERIDLLSGAGDQWPVFVSADGCDVYFVSRENTAPPANRLYVASRR